MFKHSIILSGLRAPSNGIYVKHHCTRAIVTQPSKCNTTQSKHKVMRQSHPSKRVAPQCVSICKTFAAECKLVTKKRNFLTILE